MQKPLLKNLYLLGYFWYLGSITLLASRWRLGGFNGGLFMTEINGMVGRSTYRGICAAAVMVSMLLGGTVFGATIQHRYAFTSDASDSVGGADGVLRAGAVISGGAVFLNGSSAYVDLPNGLVQDNDDITIETWLTDSGSGNWARIFDFGSNQNVYMFLSPQSISGTMRGAITLTSNPGEQGMEWFNRMPIGTSVHVVWTYDSAARTGKLYLDGVLIAQNSSMTIKPSDMGFTANNWLGRSQWSGDSYLFGSIDEFRIWDGAMTAAEVQGSYNEGPDAPFFGPVAITNQPSNLTVEETKSASFEVGYTGSEPVYVQWFRDAAPVYGETNDTYTIESVTLADSGVSFHAQVANFFAETPYIVASDTATLTVITDTDAPTLMEAASVYPDGVRVIFSETVDGGTATNPANYTITHGGGALAVTGAAFMGDTKTVLLTTDPQSLGTTYTLHVSNVEDTSAAGNVIAPDSQIEFIATQYTFDDIGAPASDSTVSWLSSGAEITTVASGIGVLSDQLCFSHKSVTGDFDVQVRIDGMDVSNSWARVGLMARDGLGTGARFAAAFSTPGPAGCQFMARTEEGLSAVSEGFFPSTFPNMWLRLRRTGDLFEGFAGMDGAEWQPLGSATIAMPSTIDLGYALGAGDESTPVTARFLDDSPGSGNIVSSIQLPFEPLGPSSRRTAMIISEIMVDTPSAWGGTNSLEFVEIYNTGLITEDLTGHRFTGEIDYTFPDGTMLAPGEYMVIAKDPAAAYSFYGVSCLGPYEGKLNNGGGTLRFRNELDGILLEVEYNNKAPWPVAPFGSGHSLVLSHPSYGENDPRAWSASDLIGGSPGLNDSFSADSARGVVINEYLAHTDLPQVDYVELFNTGSSPVDLSGAWLSDEAGTNKFRISNGTIIPARGFLSYDETELGFALSADGEEIFLVNSNLTRVLDAVSFRGQANGVAEGRYPDGAPGFQSLDAVTEGSANAAPLLWPVVINEIMYHPISESNNDEYIELYNRTGSPVDISNWRLQSAVSYQFPDGTQIPANGYIVVAENLTNLVAKYPQLNTANTFGSYTGSLNNASETIRLAMPEDLIATNEFNEVTTNIYYIPVDEVTYLDGGRWGQWSDGGGSSLELIDPDADNRQPANWADSDETGKAPWTVINVTSVLENGQTFSDQGPFVVDPDRMELFLQGAGEVLLDDLEFQNNGGGSLVLNGSFSSLSGWTKVGTMRNSYLESGVGVGGTSALHIMSSGRGDPGANKMWSPLLSTVNVASTNTGTIKASARWLKGSPYILLRISGNWIEVSQRLNVPDDCGTPGQPNSQAVANAGPAIHDVTHWPILPASGDSVLVTARAEDPDDVSSMTLNYRVDPSASYSSLSMLDNGTGGDAVAGDGLYSATLAGQVNGTLIAFYVSASDGSDAAQFPAEAPQRECLVRWGEAQFPGSLGTYRLWLTSAKVNDWISREELSNEPIDATFVYGNYRVVYNADTQYSGSPFHSSEYSGPTGFFPCDYEINFHPGERFLGSEPFVLAAEDTSGGFWFDTSTQVDLTGTWIGRKLGLQYNYRRHVHMVVNGLERGTIYLDTQQPNGEMLDEYFPNDSQTELRKVEDWFEFSDGLSTFGITTANIRQHDKTGGGIDTKRYRWNWRPRATRDPDNWYNFTNLVDAANDTGAPDRESRIREWMDVRNFLRPIVTHHVCGSWDSYGYERGKNMYAFKPDGEGWRLLMWDIELALGSGSNGTSDSIYSNNDSILRNIILSIPAFRREYLMAFQEAVDGPMVPGVADAILLERYANLLANGVYVDSPQFIIGYIAARRNYLQAVLPSAFDFQVDGPTSYTVETNSTVITGAAPLQISDILVNDIAYPVEWMTTTTWSMLVPLQPGTNVLSIVGIDRFGDPVSGANALLTVTSTGGGGDPLDAVVINEWMADNDAVIADPADGDYEDWFELYNAGSSAVDIGGCYLTDDLLDPFAFQVPTNGHYSIPAGGYLLVWADGEPEQNSVSLADLHADFSLGKGGEEIGLYAPDGRELDTVTFGQQITDRSEGRYPEGGEYNVVLESPTPGTVNALPEGLPVLQDASIDGSNVTFEYSSATGHLYQIFFKSSLTNVGWAPLGSPVPGTGGTISFSHDASGDKGFYVIVFE